MERFSGWLGGTRQTGGESSQTVPSVCFRISAQVCFRISKSCSISAQRPL